jgi:hypothetical protein
VGRQPAILNLLGFEDDDVTLLDRTGNLGRERDEPVAGSQCRFHAPGLDVAEENWLAEQAAGDEREHHGCEDDRNPDPKETTNGHQTPGYGKRTVRRDKKRAVAPDGAPPPDSSTSVPPQPRVCAGNAVLCETACLCGGSRTDGS